VLKALSERVHSADVVINTLARSAIQDQRRQS
jgi:hypothetical protein